MTTAQPQRDRIPFGRHSSHFFHIYNNLVEVLTETKAEIKAKGIEAKVLWVSCRLNRTDQNVPSPVFAGWVENNDAISVRLRGRHLSAPIDIRFGDSHVSTLYKECVGKKPGELVTRDWSKQSADPTSQEIGRNFYGETNRMSVPIKINGDSVGTLNAAFEGDPSQDKEIRDVLFRWAQEPKSDLVTYIENSLEYSTV